MQAAAASYAENVRVFRMEEPPRGSRYHYIYRVTARAYRAGDRCTYIPDYERQPDPETRRAWHRIGQPAREYTEYLAAGGRPIVLSE
jgi:hypothetical protein